MTPKEKAFELVKKYVNTLYPDSLKGMPVIEEIERQAKQCALIAVEEIIDFITGGEPDWTGKTIFWQEVKNEIEKRGI